VLKAESDMTPLVDVPTLTFHNLNLSESDGSLDYQINDASRRPAEVACCPNRSHLSRESGGPPHKRSPVIGQRGHSIKRVNEIVFISRRSLANELEKKNEGLVPKELDLGGFLKIIEFLA
jgi:hypothetical protein